MNKGWRIKSMHSKNWHAGSSSIAEFMRQVRSNPLFRSSVLLLAVLWLPPVYSTASAAEKTQTKEPLPDENSEPGTLSKAGSLVDDAHGKISDRFSRFIVQIDDFIGAGESGEQLNTSWARIRVESVKPGAEKLKLAATVKLRVVLPQSQQRFRLLVSSEDDDESSAANSDAAQREQIASGDNNNVALALRFIRTARDRFRLNYDLGARIKDDKAQLFGRFIIGYKKESILGFTNTFTNNLTYFSASGYQNSFRIDTRRTLFDRESLYFRNTIELSWRKGISGAGIGETMGIYADLGKRRALALEGITGYATSLNDGIEEKYRGAELRIRYRQNIWRPWIYYEIWPSVSWSSSNDYERAYGGLFRVEVTVGNV